MSTNCSQLFRQLRSTEDCASSAGWTHNYGHLVNLLGNAEIERRENTKEELFHHQRHRNVESRKQRSVDHLVHGVPLDTLHIPSRLSQAAVPAPAA